MALKIEEVKRYLSELTNLSDHIDVVAAAEGIRKSVHFRGPNVFILFFAIIIASVGLNVNSIPVIIGAMLISPLMGPIIGFGLGLGTNDTELVKSALRNLAVMGSISVLASTLYFLLSPLDLNHPTELLARTNPTIYDVLIALFGGFAGILETSRKEKGTVISGVAIATALMPPLCTVGYGVANWDMHYALGALYLFLLNSVLIALATYITVRFLRYPRVQEEGNKPRKRNISITLVIIILLVPSVLSAIKVIGENNFNRQATRFVETHHFIGSTYIYDYQLHPESSPATIELYLAGEKLEDSDRQAFFNEALEAGFAPDQIILKDNATTDIREKLSDEDLLRQLLQSKDEQIAAYKKLIDDLQAQLNVQTDTTLPRE